MISIQRIIEAVRKGMAVIREAQQRPRSGAKVKPGDGSLVTDTDKQVEKLLHECLKGIPDTRFLGEEGTTSGTGELILMVDPIDGTRPFALGLATSTVIVGVVHPKRGIILCVVGEPSTGRIWSATEDTPTQLWVDGSSSSEPVTVWPGQLTEQANVFLDVNAGFSRLGYQGLVKDEEMHQVMTDGQARRLLLNLAKNSKLQMTGSNGQHYAMLANGGEYAAGMINAWAGGPWDMAGVLLVEQAGGCARGFTLRDGRLIEKKSRHIIACDMMVCGNSRQTVDRLAELLYEAI